MPSTSTSPSTEHLCALCDKAAPKQCGSCQHIRYCSAECQKADWRVHKIVCKSFKDVLQAPGTNHIRAIYFPEKSSRPAFVWLRVKDTVKKEGELKVDTSSLDMAKAHHGTFRDGNTYTSSNMLRRSIPALTWAMAAIPAADNVLQLTGDHNESVAMIDKELQTMFGGPMLFYSRDRNLDTTDFCNAVEILRWFQYDTVHIQGASELANVPAVTLNCLGDLIYCHQPNATPYKLCATAIHPDYPKRIELPIGNLIGIPLVAVPALPSLPWRDRALCGSLSAKLNPNIPILNPLFTDVVGGSFVVARQDGKALHPKHMEVLGKFCIAIAMGLEGQKAQDALLAQANPAEFKSFWETFIYHEKVVGVPSPYDV